MTEPVTAKQNPKQKPARTKKPKGSVLSTAGASLAARKLAAAILEVLAGARTPIEAAQAVGVSLPRYYVLEQRGLVALVAACEPRERGPGGRPQRRIAELEKEVGRLKRERDRQQALARASQRAVGLLAPIRPPIVKAKQNGKKRRPRRPTVRALSIANSLRQTDVVDSGIVDLQQSATTEESTAPRTEVIA
jgi:hypothetical protein